MKRPGEVPVGLGRVAVVGADRTITVRGLGSCVAVVLYDPDARLGGIAHVVLPSTALARDRSNLARFAETAVPHLIGEMVREGGVRERLTARLVGGACMFAALMAPGTEHIGERNAVACRRALDEANVPVIGEALGGERGRSLRFDVAAGKLVVWSVGNTPREL